MFEHFPTHPFVYTIPQSHSASPATLQHYHSHVRTLSHPSVRIHYTTEPQCISGYSVALSFTCSNTLPPIRSHTLYHRATVHLRLLCSTIIHMFEHSPTHPFAYTIPQSHSASPATLQHYHSHVRTLSHPSVRIHYTTEPQCISGYSVALSFTCSNTLPPIRSHTLYHRATVHLRLLCSTIIHTFEHSPTHPFAYTMPQSHSASPATLQHYHTHVRTLSHPSVRIHYTTEPQCISGYSVALSFPCSNTLPSIRSHTLYHRATVHLRLLCSTIIPMFKHSPIHPFAYTIPQSHSASPATLQHYHSHVQTLSHPSVRIHYTAEPQCISGYSVALSFPCSNTLPSIRSHTLYHRATVHLRLLCSTIIPMFKHSPIHPFAYTIPQSHSASPATLQHYHSHVQTLSHPSVRIHYTTEPQCISGYSVALSFPCSNTLPSIRSHTLYHRATVHLRLLCSTIIHMFEHSPTHPFAYTIPQSHSASPATLQHYHTHVRTLSHPSVRIHYTTEPQCISGYSVALSYTCSNTLPPIRSHTLYHRATVHLRLLCSTIIHMFEHSPTHPFAYTIPQSHSASPATLQHYHSDVRTLSHPSVRIHYTTEPQYISGYSVALSFTCSNTLPPIRSHTLYHRATVHLRLLCSTIIQMFEHSPTHPFAYTIPQSHSASPATLQHYHTHVRTLSHPSVRIHYTTEPQYISGYSVALSFRCSNTLPPIRSHTLYHRATVHLRLLCSTIIQMFEHSPTHPFAYTIPQSHSASPATLQHYHSHVRTLSHPSVRIHYTTEPQCISGYSVALSYTCSNTLPPIRSHTLYHRATVHLRLLCSTIIHMFEHSPTHPFAYTIPQSHSASPATLQHYHSHVQTLSHPSVRIHYTTEPQCISGYSVALSYTCSNTLPSIRSHTLYHRATVHLRLLCSTIIPMFKHSPIHPFAYTIPQSHSASPTHHHLFLLAVQTPFPPSITLYNKSQNMEKNNRQADSSHPFVTLFASYSSGSSIVGVIAAQ